MPNRREFLRTVVAGALGASSMGRGNAAPWAAARQTPPARRRVTIAGRAVSVIDMHAHCVIPVTDSRQGHAAGNKRRRHRAEHPRSAASPRSMDRPGRRHPGAEHQRILVVCRRPRPGEPHRPGAERGARDVGGHAPRPLRRAGVGGPAASGPGGGAARGRRQAAGSARRVDRRSRERRGSVAARSTTRSGPRRPSSACSSSCIPEAPRTSSRKARLGGRGDLGNIIGNPLETTYFLSRLIFDGTLDRFPGAARLRRARRRLPAVVSRADRSRPATVRANANCANKKKAERVSSNRR